MAIDRCILASVLILLLVEVLCVVSLFSSDWIITDFAGELIKFPFTDVKRQSHLNWIHKSPSH